MYMVISDRRIMVYFPWVIDIWLWFTRVNCYNIDTSATSAKSLLTLKQHLCKYDINRLRLFFICASSNLFIRLSSCMGFVTFRLMWIFLHLRVNPAWLWSIFWPPPHHRSFFLILFHLCLSPFLLVLRYILGNSKQPILEHHRSGFESFYARIRSRRQTNLPKFQSGAPTTRLSRPASDTFYNL